MSQKFDSNPKSFWLSAFQEYFANWSQIKASLSLEIVKKMSRASRARMQWPKKVCDRMLPCSSFPFAHIHFSEIWPDFREFSLPFPSLLFMHCYTKSQSKNSKNIHEIPLSQSFSRRLTADKEPEKLWARDCAAQNSIRGVPFNSVSHCKPFISILFHSTKGGFIIYVEGGL